jgi:hypothetical protein
MPKPKRYAHLDIPSASLRRSYQAALHAKPTKLEESAITLAALLTSRAEAAAADPNTAVADLAQLVSAAATARSDLAKIIEARHRAALAMPKASLATVARAP